MLSTSFCPFFYPLVISYIAIEHGHGNSEFSHSMVIFPSFYVNVGGYFPGCWLPRFPAPSTPPRQWSSRIRMWITSWATRRRRAGSTLMGSWMGRKSEIEFPIYIYIIGYSLVKSPLVLSPFHSSWTRTLLGGVWDVHNFYETCTTSMKRAQLLWNGVCLLKLL